MAKTIILDTNILLTDPDAIFSFKDNTVIIPIGVVEELDKFKKDITELGRNARQTSRYLDELRIQGDLKEGIPTNFGGKIAVRYNGNLESFYKQQNIDLHVIHVAQETIKRDPNTPCIIVSNDVNVRIRANALGLNAEGYENNKIPHDELDKGFQEILLNEKIFEKFAKDKEMDISDILGDINTYPNYYFIFKKESDLKKTILGRTDAENKIVKRTTYPPRSFPLQAKNKEQLFILDALFDKDIKLVCIAGKAGSGKSLLSCGAGFHQVREERVYKRLLVSRPVVPMGRDIGFLPGSIEEKLDPWMQPIYDAFDVILDAKNKEKNKQSNKSINGKAFVKECEDIAIEPLTYIRGRSIHNQFLIIDECQNLTALETKTIISRAGENTKIILTGDIYQIDNPYIDMLSNGLTVVSNAFRNSSIATSIVLNKGVRSQLAEEASDRL